VTTHDEQATTTAPSTADAAPTGRPESASAGVEPPTSQSAPVATPDAPSSSTMRSDSPPMPDEPEIIDDESATARAEQTRAGNEAMEAGAEPSDDQLLFADDNLSALRSHWDDVQAAFVDDPTECVQKADALVAEVVEQLTARFAAARSRLEAQWAEGGEASTEDLRLALRRYREFFQRLLAV
jgi:hypothetical protein